MEQESSGFGLVAPGEKQRAEELIAPAVEDNAGLTLVQHLSLPVQR
jgi:hypothetical protein